MEVAGNCLDVRASLLLTCPLSPPSSSLASPSPRPPLPSRPFRCPFLRLPLRPSFTFHSSFPLLPLPSRLTNPGSPLLPLRSVSATVFPAPYFAHAQCAPVYLALGRPIPPENILT